MSIIACEKCLINTTCRDTCSKFRFPSDKTINYYLDNDLRLKRLLQHHIKRYKTKTYTVYKNIHVCLQLEIYDTGSYSFLIDKKELPGMWIQGKWITM